MRGSHPDFQITRIANMQSQTTATNNNVTTSVSTVSITNASFSDAEYSFKFYDSDADVEDEDASAIGNTIFDIDNVFGVLDAEIYNPIDSILTMESNDGRVSLAYERLTHIPRPFAERFAASTQTLDLSHNNFKDLSFLANFRHLSTLILDQNEAPLEHTFPHLPQLRILWLNNCRIYNAAAWLRRLHTCCPLLRQLSLLGNPGCLSAFNGGTAREHLDYRLFVVGALPQLEHLDDAPVTQAQRTQAVQHRSAYATHGGSLSLVEKFVNSSSTGGGGGTAAAAASLSQLPSTGELFGVAARRASTAAAAGTKKSGAGANGSGSSSSSTGPNGGQQHHRDGAAMMAAGGGQRDGGQKSTTSVVTDSSPS